jgi:hypothetical protein
MAVHPVFGCASGPVDVHLNVVGSGHTVAPSPAPVLVPEAPLDPEPTPVEPDAVLLEPALDAPLPLEPDPLLVPASAEVMGLVDTHEAKVETRAERTRGDRMCMDAFRVRPERTAHDPHGGQWRRRLKRFNKEVETPIVAGGESRCGEWVR